MRYAVWVDDESSRIDVTQIGTKAREDGLVTAEIPFFAEGVLTKEDAEKQTTWRTGDTAGVEVVGLGATKFPKDLSYVATAFSRGYDVLAHTPSYAQSGSTQKNGYDLPLRGRAKRNLNWNGHTQGNVDTRVERLTEWMANGAQGFFNKRNLSLWTGSGVAGPNYQTISSSNPFASVLRMEQFRSISASLIDYLDTDNIPTQPSSLAALNYGNPIPGASPVFLMQDVPRPSFFGADRTVRINEVQIIWNSRGAADGYKANTTVKRTGPVNGIYQYEIPVTYRFELWNMDENAIPATTYEVRTTYIQQILSSTFGSVGALPIPEETELVLPLNSGNDIPFAPNEIKLFEINRTYTRASNLDRGTSWENFRTGTPDGKPINYKDTVNDQPDGHQRQACVLLNAGTGEWLHATNYLQMNGEAPADGVVSVGPGNKGASQGNRLNDPRMTPLRMYYNLGLTAFDGQRDWASNSGGKMGSVNNGINGSDYQDFKYWLDRPYLAAQSNLAPLQGISRVENRPMLSPGELGRIFDPSWTHPVGRGTDGSGPFNQGVASPFRGGATLAIGQASKATTSGSTAADHLDAKPWNIMEIFAIKGNGTSMNNNEFGDLEWRGRVNLNCQKAFNLSTDTKSNHEQIMELAKLRLGAAASPEKLKFNVVADELKGRLTKGWKRPDGRTISTWKEALPLYSPGQLSELKSWSETASYDPSETAASGRLGILNRNDPAREEAMMRSANLVTTRSHCYRIFTAGEVIDRAGKLLGRRLQENVIFFNCTWDTSTGELKTVKPEILYVRSL